MRKFVISDIHGNYDGMMKLFQFAKFDPLKDQLVVMGDMINRGPQSGKVLREIKQLHETYENVYATIGNHEEMMLWYLDQKSDMWAHFGGKESAADINDVFKEEGVTQAVEWVKSLPLYMEDNQFIYAHAGMLSLEDRNKRSNLWLKKKELYTLNPQLFLARFNGKILIHGHTPTCFAICDGARLNIDLGASVMKNGRLGLIELEQKVVYSYHFGEDRVAMENIKDLAHQMN
ncbi:metallophosphoesterase [Priestia endophytica]|uniref:metallophosphoesterase n=1 Tax=Priestia endophytica TaxID=135735 RepID=UPI00227F700E|nr:metallophosphoesterase [Priestia endophytica]MCY8231970.1 metallophosphoesterase [Priestia endophytica]